MVLSIEKKEVFMINNIHTQNNNRTVFLPPRDISETIPYKGNIFFPFELLRSQAFSPSPSPSEGERKNLFTYGKNFFESNDVDNTKRAAVYDFLNKIKFNESIEPPINESKVKNTARRSLNKLKTSHAPLSSKDKLVMKFLEKFLSESLKDRDFFSVINDLFLKQTREEYEAFYKAMNIPEAEGDGLFRIFYRQFQKTTDLSPLKLCEKCIDVIGTAIASRVYKFTPSQWIPTDSITTFMDLIENFGPCMITLKARKELFHQPATSFTQLRGVNLFKYDQNPFSNQMQFSEEIIVIGAAIHDKRHLVYYLNNTQPDKVFVIDYKDIQENANVFFVYSPTTLSKVYACHNEKKSPEEHAKLIWEHNTPKILKDYREFAKNKIK